MSWPPKPYFRDSNKETIAQRRAVYLDREIEVLTNILETAGLDVAEADSIGITLNELHGRYERLQDKYFNGDGRSKRKRRKQRKAGDATDLLR